MKEIIVKGIPIAKKRPRFARRGKFVVTYNSQETEEGRFLFEVQKQWKHPPVEGPIRVHCSFQMPVPKSTSKKKTKAMLEEKIKHTKKPDIDNLLKFTLDCLNGVAFKDDSQIIYLGGGKFYSREPQTLIMIGDA